LDMELSDDGILIVLKSSIPDRLRYVRRLLSEGKELERYHWTFSKAKATSFGRDDALNLMAKIDDCGDLRAIQNIVANMPPKSAPNVPANDVVGWLNQKFIAFSNFISQF